MTIADQIARYALGLDASVLPGEVVRCAKDRVVDSLACALGAYGASPARAAEAVARSVPVPQATLLGSDRRTTPDLAALVNGILVRFLDYNDGYMAREPGHPSDNISACLAVAESEGATGRDLLAAIVVAYEVQMRLQEAAALNRRGWDHVNYVLVSAAAAASRLMRLDPQQTAHAIAIALNGHIALRQARSGELSDWKGVSAANAARNAIVATRLAREGMTGPAPIFEGRMGFIAQVSGDLALDIDAFASMPGDDFRILASLIKPFPTNGELQTAVAAAIQLRDQGVDPARIEHVHIETTDIARRITADDEEKWRPTTRETADHSLPYNVARGLLDGELTLDSFDVDRLDDPRAVDLMRRTTVAEDPALTAQFPQHLGNRVTVTLGDGTTRSQEVVSPATNGPLRALMTSVDTKFRRMAAPHLSLARQDDTLRAVEHLDQATDFKALLAAMVPDLH